MGRGKQNAAGQAQRRQQIIDYIREHGPVKSGELCKALSIARSSLSDDINAINAQTAVILCPKRGYYEYNTEAAADNPDGGTIRETLGRQDIRQWYILALLSDMPLSFSDLQEALEEAGIQCNTATLRKDLRNLAEAHLITRSRSGIRSLYGSSSLLTAGKEELTAYRKSRTAGKTNPRVLISAYASLDRKISRCIPDTDMDAAPDEVREQRIGKQNRIPQDLLDMLERFERFPYMENVLSVPYTTNLGNAVTTCFSVGMIVYSVETNRIYLAGKNGEGRNTVIALDSVDFEKTAPVPDSYNYHYGSSEFRRMFDEMFHLSTDEPVHVRVRFQNLPFVAAKISRLCEARKEAAISFSDDGQTLIYTDRLRGLGDFARYLRRFGKSAVAEAPPELADKMVYTSRRVLELYKGADDEQT